MAEKTLHRSIDKLKKLLKREGISYCKLILFGSHAKGLARAESDIDLCLVVQDDKYDIDELRQKLILVTGLNDLLMDVLPVSEKEYQKNLISPLLHEIRTHGVEV